MIVVAIIAVIAAIAVPALMASQRASNERNASASLRTLATAENDFKGNDRDGNFVRDFWTRDVSGLFGLVPIGGSEGVRLIDITVAGADSNPQGTAATPTAGDETAVGFYTTSSPKGSYWFIALLSDDSGTAYAQNTQGRAPLNQSWFNHNGYGFMCFSQSKSAGRNAYYISEDNVVLKRSTPGNVSTTGGGAPGTALNASAFAGTSPTLQWPAPDQLKSDYAKLD
jgi:type II secretory pathway pseudopilin PulG